MKYSIVTPAAIAALILSMMSCTGTDPEETGTPVKEPVVAESFETRTKREIEAKLQIPATEKYTWKVYREYINSDTIKDAIVTVNRLSFAIDDAIRRNKTAKSAELGYMGNYNFFMYYDGALDKYSVPIPVPSTPGRPLDVTFESVTSPTRKDVLIDYRIRNMGSRAYFAVLNESDLLLVFRWNRFDFAGTTTPKALLHSLEDNAEGGAAKDILIYESELDNNADAGVGDIYDFVPVITKKKKVLQHFVYEPRAAKYRLK